MLPIRALLLVAIVAACAPVLPPPEPVKRQVALDQQWSAAQRSWFHHVSQGTATFGIPYEWFMAMPAPEFGATGWLSDPAYLTRFGFIASPASEPDNPAELPIGFARGAVQVDPTTNAAIVNPASGAKLTEIGLTCAACHTGQIVYGGAAITIDGGSAMLDLGKLQTALGLAIVRTAALPERFDRFADRLMGPDASPAARDLLREQLSAAVIGVAQQIALDQSVAGGSVTEGAGRLDALNRIGNQVFAIDMPDSQGRPTLANYAPTAAPVHFPPIWDVPWFSWAQYDSSIQRPMVRNAGEAMGVAAPVNLSPGAGLFASSIDFDHLHQIELALQGPYPPGATPLSEGRWTGLTAPKWPAELPAIDPARAARGGALYGELCAACHLPAPKTAAFWDPKFWRPASSAPGAHSFLEMPLIPISVVGTDGAEAAVLGGRQVSTAPVLGIKSKVFGEALGAVVQKVAQRWYGGQQPPLTPAQQDAWNGYRPNGIRAPLSYRTRPLDGIWATPPYLHNGAVPNLYALLSPVAERPAVFWLGRSDYDPVLVGYDTAPLEGGFKLDTGIAGNRNGGHAFEDGPVGNGVIGRRLTPDERFAIIEFLKTL